LSKSFLREVVVSRIDSDDDEKSDEDRSSLEQSTRESMLDQSNNDRHNGCGEKNLIDYIFKVLGDQLPNRLDVWWLELVWPVIVDSIYHGINLDTFLKIAFEVFGELIYTIEVFNNHSGANDHLIVFFVFMVIVKNNNFT
jgi:hypothetical protein